MISTIMKVEPLTLTGQHISLEPLKIEHIPQLCDVGLDESLWKWTVSKVCDEDAMREYVRFAISDQEKGTALPFVNRENSSERIVGSTRFGNIDIPNRKAEIGWTWVTPDRQRSYVNTEAKLLMLTHAFEVWKCIRVEFKTDVLNDKSRIALGRIGAREEGILRNHMITESGRFRDSIYFSIIESEWPEVKSKLRSRLDR